MYGAKKMAKIQSGLKPTSASDKREGLRDKRKRQVDNLNAENSERFIKDAQAKRTSASD